MWLKTAGFFSLLGCASAPMNAQPSISLGAASAQALQEAPLSLRFEGVREKRFVQLRLRVRFPSRQLDFDRIEMGEPDRRLRVTPRVEAADRTSEEAAILSLEIEAPESIPSGELLELVFRTTDEIYEAEELPIRILEASLTDSGGGQAAGMVLEDGKITVTIPVFACFFYLH